MKELLARHIRDGPDFPKKGILFKDVTPVLERPEVFKQVIEALARKHAGQGISKIAVIESRGFLFGAPLSYALGAGLCLLRKPGKLPRKAARESYALEYGSDALELHEDSVARGERILIVDDLLATGGTAAAAGKLVERLGGDLAGYSFVIELAALGGRKKLHPREVHALITY